MASVANRVIKNTLTQLVASAITLVSSLVVSVMLARQWGVEELGKYSFVMSFAIMFAFSCDWGLNRLIIREIARDRERVTKYVSSALPLGIIFSSVTMISIILSINLMGRSSEINLAVYLAGLWTILGVLASLFRGAFHAFEKMEYETITLFIEKAFVVAFGVAVIFMNWGLINLLLVLVISRALNFGAGWIIYVRKIGGLGLEVHWNFWKSLVRAAFPFGLNLLFTAIYAGIGVIILSLMRGNQEVGFYRAAMALSVQFTPLAIALNNSLLPILSRSYISAQESFKIAFEKSYQYLLTLGLPLMIGICLLAEKFIVVIYGEEFFPSIASLQILSIAIPLQLIINTSGTVLTSGNRQGMRTAIVGVGAVSNLIMNMFFIPLLGYIGTSIAAVLTQTIMFALAYFCISRYVCMFSLPRIIIRPLLSGLAMGVFIYFCDQIPLLVLIGASITVYVVVLYFVGGLPKEDINRLKELPPFVSASTALHHLRRE